MPFVVGELVSVKLTTGASNVKRFIPVPTTVLTETAIPGFPTPAPAMQFTVVDEVHEVVLQVVESTLAEGVKDVAAKLRPEIVTELWAVRPLLDAKVATALTEGASNEKNETVVPTRDATVRAMVLAAPA
jgi:hypothetical protein